MLIYPDMSIASSSAPHQDLLEQLLVNGRLEMLPKWSLDIESSFQFVEAKFQPLQLESLLDQAADLLERGLRDRLEWNRLRVQLLRLVLELWEASETKAIRTAEIADGAFSYPHAQSQAEKNALSKAKDDYSNALAYLASLLDTEYSEASVTKQCEAAYKNAEASGGFVFRHEIEVAAGNPDFTGSNTYQFDGKDNDKQRTLGKTSEYLTLQSLSVARKQARAHLGQVLAEHDAASARLDGIETRVTWDDKNQQHQADRNEILNKLLSFKLQASSEGGPLDFLTMMNGLQVRFNRDLNDALNRLNSTYVGLAKVFGKERITEPPKAPTKNLHDACLCWVRDSIAFVIERSHFDQGLTLPISLRRILGRRQFEDGLKLTSWTFPLTADIFGNHSNLRLRAVTAFVVSKEGKDHLLWEVKVIPPKTLAANGEVDEICEKIPPVTLGRVRTRADFRDPELGGIITLRNASPVGTDWQVSIRPSGDNEDSPKESLVDVVLDLTVVFNDGN